MCEPATYLLTEKADIDDALRRFEPLPGSEMQLADGVDVAVGTIDGRPASYTRTAGALHLVIFSGD